MARCRLCTGDTLYTEVISYTRSWTTRCILHTPTHACFEVGIRKQQIKGSQVRPRARPGWSYLGNWCRRLLDYLLSEHKASLSNLVSSYFKIPRWHEGYGYYSPAVEHLSNMHQAQVQSSVPEKGREGQEEESGKREGRREGRKGRGRKA